VSRSNRERGSASIWVIACCALLLAITRGAVGHKIDRDSHGNGR